MMRKHSIEKGVTVQGHTNPPYSNLGLKLTRRKMTNVVVIWGNCSIFL